MANKKINELDSRSSLSLSDLMAVGDPSTGYLYKTTISDLKTLTGAGVISFNGRFGAVSPAEGDYSLTQLSDVIITSASNGQLLQYNGSNWVNATLDLSGYVPYTGATANVNLGTYDLTADVITGATGSFASSGDSNTFAINHSSGSGIALNITKGGNGEGLYINKTSGSGNAATIVGTLNATTLVKNGGTSSQFLKADGSVDSNTYVTTNTTQTITGDKTYSGVNIYDGYQTRFSMGIAINNTTSGGAVGSHTVIGANVNGLQINLAGGGYNNLNFASTSAGNTYTLPNATGTIALTSDLSGYLPLSGGTLTGALNINLGSGTGLNVASDLVVFRASTGFATPRQITLAAGNGATTYLEAKGYGANYITDFGIRTYNASGTAFDVFFGTSAGDVGIGTTSPAAKLDVNGTGRYTGTLTAGASNGNIRLTGSTDGFLGVGESNGTLYLTDWATGAKGLSIVLSTGAATFSSSVTAAGVTIGDSDVRSSSNVLTLGGTSEVVRITGGNVGIGTSSPVGKLMLYSPSGGGDLFQNIVSSSGGATKVGINFSPAFLENHPSLYPAQASVYAVDDNYSANLIFATKVTGAVTNALTERMRITSGGLVGIGTTTFNSSALLQILFNGSSQSALDVKTTSGDANNIRFLNSSGSVVGQIYSNASTTSYITTSDYRLKENAQPIQNALNKVLALNPITYNWKEDGSLGEGFIAHELQEHIPMAVSGVKDAIDKDGKINPQGIDLSKIVPYLVKSIQELKAEIDELKNK